MIDELKEYFVVKVHEVIQLTIYLITVSEVNQNSMLAEFVALGGFCKGWSEAELAKIIF